MSINTQPDTEPAESVIDLVGPWVALIAAIGLTASGEYALARLVGFPNGIAWAFPVAVDVYVVQAIRRHRDVPAAIALMIATQALYHLGDKRLFGVDRDGSPQWWLIVGVVAIAPLIVWRVHRIREDDHSPATEPAGDLPPVGGPQTANTTPAVSLTDTDKTTATTPTEPAVPATEPADNTATTGGDTSTTTGDTPDRQNPPTTPPTTPAKKPSRRRPTGRAGGSPKAPRRSLDEWVDIASPIFHAEFARLRRQPTANEFATAIETSGLGRVSDSTAKNIRTEILDRTDLPALD